MVNYLVQMWAHLKAYLLDNLMDMCSGAWMGMMTVHLTGKLKEAHNGTLIPIFFEIKMI